MAEIINDLQKGNKIDDARNDTIKSTDVSTDFLSSTNVKSPAQILAEKTSAQRKRTSASSSPHKKTSATQKNKTKTSNTLEKSNTRNKTSDKSDKQHLVNNRNEIRNKSSVKQNITSEIVTDLLAQDDKTIFSLDIGTRTVVGILAQLDEDGIFNIIATCSVPHTQRAMMDGQIEDIKQVAKIVKLVKQKLEMFSGIKLTKVAIAAAGRALKTSRVSADFSTENMDLITEESIKSFEIEAVMKAQSELDIEGSDTNFYCVGHTVVSYELDGYKIKTLAGHRGKRVLIDLIAAFLPSGVVESLYAVTDVCELEVVSLTLEPIAAMHVIIPPEVRLINIALVDIGAGTSDIAISRNGSIVAYAMATIAGDEITEEIIRTYLVSFDVAEEMKLSSGKHIKYKDILGYEHTIESKHFFESIFPAAGNLADTIAAAIIEANGKPPAAVFLIGGGSQLPGLTDIVAEKLEMPKDRVAVGGRNNYRNISLEHMSEGSVGIDGPEFVTPIGIGLAAALTGGYDFAVVTLNGKKKRLFDTKILTVLDLLMLGGYKSGQILGKTGKGLTFTVNNEKKTIAGNPGKPSELTVNGKPASINTTLSQGDEVLFTPAVDGISASARIYDVTDGVDLDVLTVDGISYPFGRICNVNGKYVTPDYQIRNFDTITITEVRTLYDLTETLPFDTYALDFYIGGRKLSFDYELVAGDAIVTADKKFRNSSSKKIDTNSKNIPDKQQPEKQQIEQLDKTVKDDKTEENGNETVDNDENTAQNGKDNVNVSQNNFALNAIIEVAKSAISYDGKITDATDFWVTLNGSRTILPEKNDKSAHEFVELMALANLDLENPPPSRNIVITLNGKTVSFTDVLHIGDDAVVKWAQT